MGFHSNEITTTDFYNNPKTGNSALENMGED
jgi:hypothetical protein